MTNPVTQDQADLLPVRMLNEYAYCPRLFHLMHVEGRWADNKFTLDGKHVHRRADRIDGVLPDVNAGPDADANSDKRGNKENPGDEPPEITRAVHLGSDALGLTAKLDLVSTAENVAVPVETKRGRVPNNEQRSWEPERVQLMAQGLLLREHGYQCDHGVLYFAASRTRVDVPFSNELETRTQELLTLARQATQSEQLPDPLDDSPKCNGCSLAGICLPDETLAMKYNPAEPAKNTDSVRRLYPARDDALPLYVQEQGAYVGKSRNSLIIKKSGEQLARTSLKNVSQLVLCGNISISAQTIHLLCQAGVPVVHLSSGHWFYGITHGITLKNAFARSAQFRECNNEQKCLIFAKAVVTAKGTNQRTLLRRNASGIPQRPLEDMAEILPKIENANSVEQLLGLEGNLAAHYFSHFQYMLKPRDFDACWEFKNRNRRPPKDPVNAMLSFGYALLAKECTVALLAEGLDPWWGLYHKPRHGRPSLALDMMEEFRPLVVDSAVISAINTGMLTASDFTRSKAACILTPKGRKAFIRAYEARLDQLVTHPVFQYKCSWRAVIKLQAKILARWLRGEVPNYIGMTTR